MAELCDKMVNGHHIYGSCTKEKGHEGEHSMPIDYFEWTDDQYCPATGCTWLTFNKGLCWQHREVD